MIAIDRLRPPETLKIPESSYAFVIMRPGGNDTALVEGLIADPNERKEINDMIMKAYPNIEQVGFFADGQLQMAGGEFCGNATRSLASLKCDGIAGEVLLKVSGVSNLLRAGVTRTGEAYAQMPIYDDPSRIAIDNGTGDQIVSMEGITQVVTFNRKNILGKNDEQIKQIAMDRIRQLGLENEPAAGIMYTEIIGGAYTITPVVYVKSIDTLFLETACGSGTTAIGLAEALRTGKSVLDLPVIQPSGMDIKISVDFDGQKFGYTQICGPIEELGSGIIRTDGTEVQIRKASEGFDLEQALSLGGLLNLYRQTFTEERLYREVFTDDDIRGFFVDYLNPQTGKLYLAYENGKIVGFAGFQKMSTVPTIAALFKSAGFATENMWYAADVGTAIKSRRQKVAKSLLGKALREIGSDPIAMRTTLMNENSKKLFSCLGFGLIPDLFQDVSGLRTSGRVETDRRLFMVRSSV